MSKAKTPGQVENAKINRAYYDVLGEHGGSSIIMEDLERHFELKSMVSKTRETGMVDPNQTLVNCGAYEFLSYIKQRIALGERNE